MSIFLRSAYALSKTPLASNVGRIGSVRMYSLGKDQSSQYFGHHPEAEIGDLVTYTDANGGKSAGYLQKIFDEKGAQAKKEQLAEIQNYHTKKVAYTDLKNVQSVARKHDLPHTATTAKATTTTAQQKTAPQPPKATHTTTPPPHTNATKPAAAASTAHTKQDPAQQHLKESAQKLDHQLNSESSPLNADFAPGDIVRYRVGANFTAGVVLEVVYSITHDEHGNFHGATKENPMAKLENLWTKHVTYHHLNVLEHVKRARDVTPGRLAEQEYAVYDKK